MFNEKKHINKTHNFYMHLSAKSTSFLCFSLISQPSLNKVGIMQAPGQKEKRAQGFDTNGTRY